VEKIAPPASSNAAPSPAGADGIMAIDAMIPIGRGQRELSSATFDGQTTIGVDTMINQARINKVGVPQATTASARL